MGISCQQRIPDHGNAACKSQMCDCLQGRFIEAVWGCDSDVENNVVWTYISRLRRILKQLDSKAVIRTAKGIGFALEREND